MVAGGAHKRLLERPQARLCASCGRELRRHASEGCNCKNGWWKWVDTEVGVGAELVTSRKPHDIAGSMRRWSRDFAERTHTKHANAAGTVDAGLMW